MGGGVPSGTPHCEQNHTPCRDMRAQTSLRAVKIILSHRFPMRQLRSKWRKYRGAIGYYSACISLSHVGWLLLVDCNGLFTLPDSDSDSNSDYKPNRYIVTSKTVHTVWGQIQISIPSAKYRNGIGIEIGNAICLSEYK